MHTLSEYTYFYILKTLLHTLLLFLFLFLKSSKAVSVSLTNTQVLRFRKAFANNFSANIKLSKTKLHKIE